MWKMLKRACLTGFSLFNISPMKTDLCLPQEIGVKMPHFLVIFPFDRFCTSCCQHFQQTYQHLVSIGKFSVCGAKQFLTVLTIHCTMRAALSQRAGIFNRNMVYWVRFKSEKFQPRIFKMLKNTAFAQLWQCKPQFNPLPQPVWCARL